MAGMRCLSGVTFAQRRFSSRNSINHVGIQMISESLRSQLFDGNKNSNHINVKYLEDIKSHLKKFKIPFDSSENLEAIDLNIPKLKGSCIDDHFRNIAQNIIDPYLKTLENFLSSHLPFRPKVWMLKQGWTKYDSLNGKFYPVACPNEDALVFDLESLVSYGNFPVIATAVSPGAWYSWCSRYLFEKPQKLNSIAYNDLIPVNDENCVKKSLVIGHNASSTYFLDTMSLHIAVAGLTSLQKMLFMAKKSGSRRKEVVNHEQQAIQKFNFSSSCNPTELSLWIGHDVTDEWCYIELSESLKLHLNDFRLDFRLVNDLEELRRQDGKLRLWR
ncbi:hypothetical protein HELRODRAFT_176011 [Helobdella robusta]|uniref:DNA mitochondrial polymerase exonuclease domain-containing protein n=1 Tax=Helobdella robusta TaxID=6412 RepID=T1FA09_HELRO|nr:hypothetical protein HELRODRAFT_176011 [Helobdella robusta]ESO00181.1 hypothetical protein HELRODRAFT_176011 [Helobdella robusta]